MKKIESEELKLILENHKRWLRGEGGERANLRYANLRYADLKGADLNRADLRDANLEGACSRDADLGGADLNRADLRGVNLMDADLRYASLENADLRNADLRGACLLGVYLENSDLRGADLRGTKLSFAKWDECKIDNSVIVKEVGEYKRDVLYLYDLDVVYCGCFMGSLEEFKEDVEEKYGANKMGYEIVIEEFEKSKMRWEKGDK